MKTAAWTISILAAMIMTVFPPKDFKDNDLSFDSQTWKSGDSRTKGQMVTSLLKQEDRLGGKSLSEIKEILGEPNLEGSSYLSHYVTRGFLIEDILPSKNYIIAEFDNVSGTFTKLSLADA